MRRLILILLVLLAGLAIGAIAASSLRLDKLFGGGPDPETVATATLQSVREQSRLTVFAARFVAVVTSSQNRFGLSAQKTLIMPGTVRYEIDLARLTQRDLAWDAEERRLEIVLPPLNISQPQVNLNELREYGGESVLTALTDAEGELDQANRRRGQQELMRQARGPLTMRLARDAARRAVERSFVLPLRAAGLDATVVARFADEPRADPSVMDRSRPINEVLEAR
jgi:hypothetical protein